MKSKYIQYFVEGEDEEKLIQELKNVLQVIRPGRVQKLNVIDNEISDVILRTLHPKTMVVLVFDTDTGKYDILQKNIKKLSVAAHVTEVVLVPQVPNLEGELLKCCKIKNITDLLGSKSNREFKTDFLRVTNLSAKLLEHGFDYHRLWTCAFQLGKSGNKNGAERIKLKNSPKGS